MTHTRQISALAALALLVVVAGVAFAAAPVIHTTGDTTVSDTSEITDNSTISYNASSNSTLMYRADSNNSSVTILQNGTQLSSFDNGTASEISFVAHNSTSGEDYLNFTLADDEAGYTGIVADAGENVSLTYRIANDSSLSSPDLLNVTVFWDNHANKSFTRVGSSQVQTSEVSLFASLDVFGIGPNISSGPAQVERTDIGVNGENQEEITVHVADEDAQDALNVTHSAASSTGLTWLGTASIDEQPVPIVAAGEDGPEWLDQDEEAYASVSESGDEVVVHNAGAILSSDTSNVTVSVVGAERAGGLYALGLVRDYGAGIFDQAAAFGAARDPFGIINDPDFGE